MAEFYLVVEDHPITADGIKSQIESTQSGQVAVASSIAEARACVREQPPCVCLLDLALPDGDGIDFYAEVLASNPTADGILVSGI